MDRKRNLGLTEFQRGRTFDGYTLFTPYAGQTAFLINMEGDVVHRWELGYTPGAWAYLLEGGNLLFAGNAGRSPGPHTGEGGVLIELDWQGNEIWRYEDDSQHHDFSRMANGNTLVLGWEPLPNDFAARVQGGQPGTDLDGNVWADYIHEVTPNGDVVWEWHAYNALDPETDVICPLHPRHEWTHANTCKALPDGDILVSFRVLNTIGIIDKATGRFAWKMRDTRLGHQHDPSLLENGNILVFANGYHDLASTPGSRIYEIDPATADIVWEYSSNPPWEFYSHFISGAERLPNGNTLICEGSTGRLFEITHDGEVVWEYVVPFFYDHPRLGRINSCFRARRYAPGFPGIKGRL